MPQASDQNTKELIDQLRKSIEQVTVGDRKVPQSAYSKEQVELLKSINESSLPLQEKNNLLCYLYFCSVVSCRSLEADMAKEVKHRELLAAENEKLKEKGTKSNELIRKLQELNKAQSDEITSMKTKQKDVFTKEKRLREQIMDNFVESLDDLQKRVDSNTQDNVALIEENKAIREEYQQKLAQYQEQSVISKDVISKLSEMNKVYDNQIKELTSFITQLGEKVKQTDELRKAVNDYKELVIKQNEIIKSLKEGKEKLVSVVKQYETVLTARNKDIKEKNISIDQLTQELATTKKELKKVSNQVGQLKKISEYLQNKLKNNNDDNDVNAEREMEGNEETVIVKEDTVTNLSENEAA